MAYDWSRQKLARSPWRREVVPRIPSILIQRAKIGRPITYGELAAELERLYGMESKARKTLYGPALGAVGYALQELGERWGERIPPLNIIVVKSGDRLPGRGGDILASQYFNDGGAGLSVNRRAYLEAAMQAVFDYGPNWDRVAEALGVDVLEPEQANPDDGQPIDLPVLSTVYGSESAAHKALKAWVAANPDWFEDYGKFSVGVNEHRLSSGDSLDAYFTNRRESLAVEVKASNASDAELMRGIYQTIKYRAVLRAECRALRKPALCDAVLVSTQPLSKAGRALAKRLHVDFVRVPEEAEKP